MPAAFRKPTLVAALALGALSCSRRANIRDEPDGGLIAPPPTQIDAGLTPIDAGFDSSEFTACAEREQGAGCRGANDFPCNFMVWVTNVAKECQTLTGCHANGNLAVDMGDQGCVVGVSMSEPNEAFARCAIERFGADRCECGAQRSVQFLGLGNDGCADAGPISCQAAEFPCPAGLSCVNGVCVPDDGGAD